LAAFAAVIRGLEEHKTERDRLVALGRNHELWSILIKALAGGANKLPDALKSQLMDLAAWSMRYSTLAILHKLPLAPLIEVNRNIAEGLAAQVQVEPFAPSQAIVAASIA
jgi:flagellar protein FlaF